MKKRILTFIVAILGIATITHAQSISRQVISNGGGYLEAGDYKLSYTIGESIVGEVESGSFKLTQGFQQGSDNTSTAVAEIEILVDYSLYPNPATDQIHLSLVAEEDIAIELNLIDISGKVVAAPLKTWGNEIQETIDISNLSIGSYFLVVKSTNGRELQSIPFIKN